MPDRQSTAAPQGAVATGDELRQRVQNFTRLTNPDLARILDGESSQKLSALERPSSQQGHSLAHEIARHGPMTPERACALFEGCLEALARAHKLGMVHGGLRPANLWLEPHGDGLRLRLRNQEGEPRAQAQLDRHEAPRYFSPEYIRTGRVTEATDIYQIALCLGEAILGEPLAQGSDQVARIQAHLEGKLQIPAWLRESPLGHLLAWALHTDPAQRLPDALRFRRELRALREGGDPEKHPTDPDLDAGPIAAGAILDGNIRLEEVCGEGGFAVIYKGRLVDTGEQVAVKILLPVDSPDLQARVQERFLREARAAARIRHPDIVHIHQVGLTNGLCYMVMEWLQGRDLAAELEQRGALPMREALQITLDALAALAEAHRSGIVHKDLKPSNLFLWTDAQRRRRVKILDFGVAHLAAEESVRLTRTGRPACTPAYAAPEYLMRLLVTPAIDVYQMGLIFIELITGQRAVPHDLPLECINAHLHGWIEIPAQLQESPLGEVLARAIDRDHAARYPDASTFARALREAGLGMLRKDTATLTPPPTARDHRAASPRDAGRLTAPQDAQIIESWRALDRLMTLHRAQSTDYKALIALLRVCLERAPWPSLAPEWQDLEQILVPLHRATRHASSDLRHTLDLLRRQLERHLGRPLQP